MPLYGALAKLGFERELSVRLVDEVTSVLLLSIAKISLGKLAGSPW